MEAFMRAVPAYELVGRPIVDYHDASSGAARPVAAGLSDEFYGIYNLMTVHVIKERNMFGTGELDSGAEIVHHFTSELQVILGLLTRCNPKDIRSETAQDRPLCL